MPTSRDPSAPAGVTARIRELLGLRDDAPPLSDPSTLSLDVLLRHTRRQLLDCAERIGLGDLTRLTKEAIARRFQEAIGALGGAPIDPPSPTVRPEGMVPRKFDLGLPAEPQAPPAHIPWSYGQDRITAIVVDPDRLYVYWEVTDEAMTRARGALGPPGRDAWLNLRVYDVTGRLFDGTNAHSYFDHRVERSDRQWFLDIGRPTSTAVVEVGLQSHEGYFVRTARSGRADFPRRAPAPPGGVEWLTVLAASGAVDTPTPGTAPAPGPGAPAPFEPTPAWDVRQTAARGDAAPVVARDAWERFRQTTPEPIVRTLQWDGPIERTQWEAGPFDSPVASPVYVEERWAGPMTATSVDGQTHVIHGRWQVMIRGIDARGERRILARWELRRTWNATAGTESTGEATPAPAGSAHLAPGASELRLGGASEVRRGGASERRLGGASEQLTAGASERVLGGASESSGAYPQPPAPKR